MSRDALAGSVYSLGNRYIADRATAFHAFKHAQALEVMDRHQILAGFQGGQGTVRLARSVNGEFHALKTYHKRAFAPGAGADLQDEAFRAHFSASKSDWGVLPLLDVVQPAGELFTFEEREPPAVYAVMPFCWAGSLADRMAHSPVPRDEALMHMLSTAAAIAQVHDIGVAHLDIKPANMMFWDGENCGTTWSGYGLQLALTDFGSARRASDGRMLPGPLTAMYASPEQRRDGRAGQPADIWAWACIAHELLAGKPLFADNGLAASASAAEGEGGHAEAEVDWPDSNVPAWLKGLIEASLHRQPEQRPSARDIVDEFSRHTCVPSNSGMVGCVDGHAQANTTHNDRLAMHLWRNCGWQRNTEMLFLTIEFDGLAAIREAQTYFQTGTEFGFREAADRIEKTYGSVTRKDTPLYRFFRGDPQPDAGGLEQSGREWRGASVITDEMVEMALDIQVRAIFNLVEDHAVPLDIARLERLGLAWHASGRFSASDHKVSCVQALAATGHPAEARALLDAVDMSELDTQQTIRALKTFEYAFVADASFEEAAQAVFNLSLALQKQPDGNSLSALAIATIYARMAGMDPAGEPLGRLSEEARREVGRWLERHDIFCAFDLQHGAARGVRDEGRWAIFWPHLEKEYFRTDTSPLKAAIGLRCAYLYGQEAFARDLARRYLSMPRFSLPLHKPIVDYMTEIVKLDT